jgi:hypothetical protein
MGFMDDADQQRIEKRLRERLAAPKYPPIFDLPPSRVVEVKNLPEVAEEGQPRCGAIARAVTTTTGGGFWGTGAVYRREVKCEMPPGHDGPHSLAAKRIPLSKKWQARQWD